MKKYIIAIIMTIMVVSAKGQVTWNLRLGAGAFSAYYFDGYDNDIDYEDYYDLEAGAAIVGQVNIPFSRTSTFTFSPSFVLGIGGAGQIAFPIHVGKKVIFGDRKVFFPKIGFVGGYDFWDYGRGIVGPSIELAFELKHFVMAYNYYVGLIDGASHGVFATIGYKF